MESEKARDSWDFTETYQTIDLAILQSLASRNRIALRFFSGYSSLGVYTLGQIACQFSTAHAEGQDCSSPYRGNNTVGQVEIAEKCNERTIQLYTMWRR